MADLSRPIMSVHFTYNPQCVAVYDPIVRISIGIPFLEQLLLILNGGTFSENALFP